MVTEAGFILYNIRSLGKYKVKQATFTEMENKT